MAVRKKIHFYMISDASGETAELLSKAISAQFTEDVEVVEYLFPLVRSTVAFAVILEEMKKKDAPVVVLHTVSSAHLQDYIESSCRDNHFLSIPILEAITSQITAFAEIKTRSSALPGRYLRVNDDYYQRIEIINFALHHDDGHDTKGYNDADILLLGVSRTSKSPTALYLAQRGYKVANLPIINGVNIDLAGVTKPVIVGLTISAQMLMHIRYNRISSCFSNVAHSFINNSNDQYAEFGAIKDELQYASQFFKSHSIPVIDVSRKAIEEVAAEIINIVYHEKGKRQALL